MSIILSGGRILTILGTLLEGYVIYLAFMDVPQTQSDYFNLKMKRPTLDEKINGAYSDKKFEATILGIGIFLQIVGTLFP